jgi:hypothetical protein
MQKYIPSTNMINISTDNTFGPNFCLIYATVNNMGKIAIRTVAIDRYKFLIKRIHHVSQQESL